MIRAGNWGYVFFIDQGISDVDTMVSYHIMGINIFNTATVYDLAHRIHIYNM